MEEKKEISLSVLAAGALAGGVVDTAESAAKFAVECLESIRKQVKAPKTIDSKIVD